MKNKSIAILLVLSLLVPALSPAKSSYIYRQRANWVKLSKLSSKQLAGQTLVHPNSDITADEMENMLLAIQMNKKSLFKKSIDSSEVFSSFEARRFAGHIVDALSKAGPNEVVNVSVIHKRPTFILRNDYVSNINVYVNDEGVHFYFNKLFARLTGDYSQMSNIDESLKKAKSLRVTLDAREGQQLSYNNPLHLVLARSHDFATDVAVEKQKDEAINKDLLKPKKDRRVVNKGAWSASDDTAEFADTPAATPTSSPVVKTANKPSSDVSGRLRKLETLRQEKLITDSEYQKKRQEILNSR